MADSFDNSFYLPSSVSSSQQLTDTTDSTVAASDSIKPTESSIINTEVDKAQDLILVETIEYRPINYHWFYSDFLQDKIVWVPMSHKDSKNLENCYKENIDLIKTLRHEVGQSSQKDQFVVLIKGGRFEVNLVELTKRSIYWDDKKKSQVRRSLWFYKENNESRFVPYEEEYSEFLEIEYESAIRTNEFHKRIDYLKIIQANEDNKTNMELQNTEITSKKVKSQQSVISEEAFVFHSLSIMQHFTQANMLDEFGNLNSDAERPRIVKRGIDEVVDKIEPDEIDKIDHLCFVVHGIGEGCDIKFRPIVDCVNDLREIGAFINESHLKQHVINSNLAGRVEFIPISWHADLHGDNTGLDSRLKPITLPSIPKLREYSNTTILDVLFYTSPIYCQTIIGKVGNELNRLYKMFCERNPGFKGKISLIGHSLGSIIIFDLLSHQCEIKDENLNKLHNPDLSTDKDENLESFLKRLNLTEFKSRFDRERITLESLYLLNEFDLNQLEIPIGPKRIILNEITNELRRREREEVAKNIRTNIESLNTENRKTANYFNYGLAGTGQQSIRYPQLSFKVDNFFALGSPIACFLTVRGITKLDSNYKFPTCEKFFNIFHPFDPIAYRIEPLVCQSPIAKPVLMPHHKGRKRMHLELKAGITKVAEDFQRNMVGQIKSAWSSITEFAKLPMLSNTSTNNNAIELDSDALASTSTPMSETTVITSQFKRTLENQDKDESHDNDIISKLNLGKLNQGKRIDYVLQESPIESFNEYLFALASHACYWESEDTLLLIIKEIYDVDYLNDTNIELELSHENQQQASWLTQAAASTLSSNVQKTFSYFNIGLPQSISSVLSSSSNNQVRLSNSSTSSSTDNLAKK